MRTDVCVATEARLREATTLTAGASTSVRSGAGLTLVSVGAPTATSFNPIASRPSLVMRSAMGPDSASRRQASSEPFGADLFQQPSADELIHDLSNRFARNVCRQVNSAIIAPQSRRQNDELGTGEL